MREQIDDSTIRAVPPAGEAAAERTSDDLPVLKQFQKLDLNPLRHKTENWFLGIIAAFNVIAFAVLAGIFAISGHPVAMAAILAATVFGFYLLQRLSFALFYWFLHGNSVRVSATQYPELFEAVRMACDYLEIHSVPTIYLLRGGGTLELFLIKRFSRKGIFVFMSELVDNLLESNDSRELMMIIGRQLGHLKLGHFRFWFFKDVIGAFALFAHSAWWRRCHYSADRVGFLVSGNLEAARRALYVLTVGKKMAASTRMAAIEQQEEELDDSFFAWLSEIAHRYPFMIRRVVALASFREYVVERPYNSAAPREVAVLPPEVGKFQIINVTGQAIFGDGGTITVTRAMP